MSNLCLLAAGVLVQGQSAANLPHPLPQPDSLPIVTYDQQALPVQTAATASSLPDSPTTAPEFSTCNTVDSLQGIEVAARSVMQAATVTPTHWPFVPESSSSLKPRLTKSGAVGVTSPGARQTAAKSMLSSVERSNTVPELMSELTEFSSTERAPASGAQLYQQRLAALKAGKLHTRLAPDSFRQVWQQAYGQPTHEQWKNLLAQEARAVAKGKGNNRLSILVGDSLSLWFPAGRLPTGQLWLNQSISGETTEDMLKRLQSFAYTRPDQLYVMAGINDLRRGYSDDRILNNLRRIMRQLRRTHPQAKIIVQSILPTAYDVIPNDRIRSINQRLAAIAEQERSSYLDLYSLFMDRAGNLRPDLTTDGLHLSHRGYQVWQQVLRQPKYQVAFR